ncbi:MptD family putative ECF transporter S component [Streptococcus gallinaceus]|uniref:Energy-coupling factor transport system substrate-specific component n=1 Tax=Streptococcus gallinaceus TaxID=165758 RepID=A0ABV2JI51_9STRE|nr:MptD family putative ECF transporter S component [Streptococcus gallinaceus]MCP1638446.1 energy-coupling factor transport system substrate-specific component [Streptococcus gallinaceus]MCP1769467.1 energy-coupling factor transport system substrate-specific component [Streptococcus gallinaceus]
MKHLHMKDLILTGALSAVYFVGVGLGTLLAFLITRSASTELAPAFAALLCGTIYILLIAKIQKFGAISLMGAVMSLFFFFSGHFLLAVIPSLGCALLADWIASQKNYLSSGLNLLSYVIFSFGNLGPIFLMWVARDAYIEKLLERGKDMDYVNRVMIEFNLGNVSYICGSIILFAIIGGVIGQKLVARHFLTSGLVK